MIDFILASTSPARKKLLLEAGIKFRTLAPGVDEDEMVAIERPKGPEELTILLAKAKAQAISTAEVNSLVLGCDSALFFNGEILGKPLSEDVAAARWRQMRGKSGLLYSGHHLIYGPEDTEVSLATSTEVHFADLTDAQIDRYVATKEPLQVAGAFTIDGLGGAFVEKISGDYHTVVGLSLVGLRKMMTDLGLDYLSLWR
ncbi:Maf family nucleotide pyrophosphatase [Aquiluna sp.]|nr:Maf family protein [Aquiluna sp.]MDA7761253.1 Maf family nucleotide pyrophosphatase [Aquiluna sp.]MDA8927555.1 Maf family nucleotide pyrophosphatase [Aquiluna sp.]